MHYGAKQLEIGMSKIRLSHEPASIRGEGVNGQVSGASKQASDSVITCWFLTLPDHSAAHSGLSLYETDAFIS